jgi:SAM-dependent methyltransferase
VLCNQVLEHVFNPDFFLREIGRVLKPGGKLLLTVPFLWDEHEQPYDYARYSSFGLAALLRRNGFCVIQQDKLGTDAAIVFQVANAYFFKVTSHWPRPLRLPLTIPVFAINNLLGLIAAGLLPRNADLYLDNMVIAEWRP